MESLKHLLALNLRERRHFMGYSQVKLAEIVDTAPTYIAMLELEKRSPSLEMLEKIAKALEIEPSALFSKSVYSAEAVEAARKFHKAVIAGFEETLKKQIIEFEENPCTHDRLVKKRVAIGN